MSLSTERAALEKRWKAMWVQDGGADPMTPYQFENVAFEIPQKQAWARLTVRHGDAMQKSAGNPGGNYFRHPAVLFVQLFAPTAKGSEELRKLGELASNIWRAVRLDNILFQVPSFSLLDPDGPWARAIVKAPFYRDEIH
jgi:hypothetical protein